MRAHDFLVFLTYAFLSTLSVYTAGITKAKAFESQETCSSTDSQENEDPEELIPPEKPSPGVYSAKPHSMVVVIPPHIDPKIENTVEDSSQFNMPSRKPNIYLEKRY